jgi:hypothetical protein
MESSTKIIIGIVSAVLIALAIWGVLKYRENKMKAAEAAKAAAAKAAAEKLAADAAANDVLEKKMVKEAA